MSYILSAYYWYLIFPLRIMTTILLEGSYLLLKTFHLNTQKKGFIPELLEMHPSLVTRVMVVDETPRRNWPDRREHY